MRERGYYMLQNSLIITQIWFGYKAALQLFSVGSWVSRRHFCPYLTMKKNTSFIATVFSLFCWSLSAAALWGHQTLSAQRTWSWRDRVCLFSPLFLLWPTDLHKPTPASSLILHRRAEAYLQPYCTHELNSGNIINQSHTVFARMFLQYVLVRVFWVIAMAFQCGFQVVFLLQDDSHTEV